jgi:dienelactone hydrolase
MKTVIGIAVLLSAALCAAPTAGRNTVVVRGQEQALYYLPAAAPSAARRPSILFLPGDGGWRGTAITFAEQLAGGGHAVYALDTKRYLESFTRIGATLSTDQMAQDLKTVADWIGAAGGHDLVVVGWSQGGGMGVLAAAHPASRSAFRGVVTLGLPEKAVLGWNWKDTLAVAARREPDEPHFPVAPLVSQLAGVPLWMIHAGGDEYTPPTVARKLYASAAGPKRLVEFEGGNHRFDGRRDELYRALQEGMAWIAGQAR